MLHQTATTTGPWVPGLKASCIRGGGGDYGGPGKVDAAHDVERDRGNKAEGNGQGQGGDGMKGEGGWGRKGVECVDAEVDEALEDDGHERSSPVHRDWKAKPVPTGVCLCAVLLLLLLSLLLLLLLLLLFVGGGGGGGVWCSPGKKSLERKACFDGCVCHFLQTHCNTLQRAETHCSTL